MFPVWPPMRFPSSCSFLLAAFVGIAGTGAPSLAIAEQTIDSNSRNSAAGASREGASREEEVSQEEITELIEGLASNSYATRIRCRDQLSRIGLAAFDQLREAREHPDSEVAIVARRLTSGLQVQWSSPGDSSAVRELLLEYGSRSIAERQERISQLAALSRAESFSPLLRLTRFEPEPSLARAAALEIMRQDAPVSGASRIEEANSIESQLNDPQLIANAWLLQYASELRSNQVSPQQWQALLDRHRGIAMHGDSASTDTTHHLLELIWITAERAIAENSPQSALEIVQNNVDLIPARTRDLIQATNWALDHLLHPVVASLYENHAALYRKSPILLYSAAEAYSRMDQAETANALAEAALGVNPLPNLMDDSPEEFVHPQVIRLNAQAHVKIADELSKRGLFRWAEEEFQLVIDRLPLDHTMSALARSHAAEMHAELQDHEAVIAMLEPLALRIEQDNDFQERLIADQFSSAKVRSNLDFHRGLLMIQQDQLDSAKAKLREAFETNPINIDILITMYRLEGDEEWQQSVRKTLTDQIGFAEAEVNEAINTPRRLAPFLRGQTNFGIAERLNAYAWLVSNTEGDYEKALKYSKQSLLLTPNEPALMDTCARCYFATGDLEAAVKMQAEACRLMPHSPPLLRQLNEFKAALEQTQPDA